MECVYLSANRFSMAWENGIQNSISIFRFSFSHDIEKQIWISFFVFTSLWKTHLNFVFRFRILDFEKRIWISFFVFTSLWKTDNNNNNNNNVFMKKHPIKLHIWCYNIYWQKKNYNDQDEKKKKKIKLINNTYGVFTQLDYI